MKYLLAPKMWGILITACLYSTLVSSQQKQYEINAVAFYNLENLFDTENDPTKNDDDFTPSGAYNYTEEIYKKKLHNLAFVLSQLATDKIPDGPAIIGVSEVENEKVLLDLVAQPELKNRNLRVIHFDSPDYRGIDVGMLYNPKYFKVLAAKALPVEISENGRKEATRDVLYVTGKLGEDTVHVFVNHWPSRRGGEAATVWKRAKAAAVSKTVIDSLMKINPNTKAIIMGDLNDDPIDPSVAKTLGAVDKEKVKPGGLFNPWITFYKNGVGTLGYNDSWNLFDQIILSAGFANTKAKGWQYYKAEIFNRKFLKNQFGQYKGYPHRSFVGSTWQDGYSDHFPTIIYLTKEITTK
jgi:hypothetical protein